MNYEKLREMKEFLKNGHCGNLQWIAANDQKKALAWYPGNSPLTQEKLLYVRANASVYGFTGRMYDENTVIQGSGYDLVALMIDIDDFTDYNRILSLTKEYSILYSTGGHGLRLVKRIYPVHTECKIMGTMQEKTVEILRKNDIPVCVYDENVQYLVGGKIDWIYRTDTVYTEDIPYGCSTIRKKDIITPIDVSCMSPSMQECLELIGIPVQAGINSIWIKEVYERLHGTKYEFKTSSPMKSTRYEINGMLIVSQTCIKIKAFCDRYATTLCSSL